MRALFVLLLLFASAAEPTPPVDPELGAGISALAAKDAPGAVAALSKCAARLPECRWQLGWAYWQQRDWAHVVDTWSALPPDYPELAGNLSTAKGQLEAAGLATRLKGQMPATFTSTAPAGATLHLRAVGDMMIGTAFPAGALPPDAGASAFASVAEALRAADFTFGNLEGPLCDTDQPSTKCGPNAKPGSCYAFRTPTSYAHWYKEAGFDVVSVANNHANDFGDVCRDQTQTTLDQQGIRYSGRPGTVATWTQNGLKVALIGFHTNASCHDLNDLPTAVALVSGLAASNDVVIVSFHGGAEGSKAQHVAAGHEQFYGEDRGDLRTFSHAVIDAGADLVLGHGPHVIRAMELYRERLIVYSMGNFSTYGRFNLSGPQGVGEIVDVTIGADGRFANGRVLGTTQGGQGIPALDPKNEAADLVRLLSEQDFPTSGVRVAQDGTFGAR